MSITQIIKKKQPTRRIPGQFKNESEMFIKRLELKNFQVIEDFNADFEGNVYSVLCFLSLAIGWSDPLGGYLLSGFNTDPILKGGYDVGFLEVHYCPV